MKHRVGAIILGALTVRVACLLGLRPDGGHEPESFGLSERDWDGFDEAPENALDSSEFTGPDNLTTSFGAANATAQAGHLYFVVGQFNTGTNLLGKLMNLNFPHAQHVPRSFYYWKHAKPTLLTQAYRESLKGHKIVPLIMIRDPLSWLWSVHKAPYNYRDCTNKLDWLSNPCAMSREHARMGPGFQYIGPVKLANLQAHWNEWTRDYLHMQDFGFHDAVLVRYEDLVLQTEVELSRIGGVLGLGNPAPFRQLQSPAKAHGASGGRQNALRKLKTKPYMGLFKPGELEMTCDRLDKSLTQRFHYNDCSN